MRYSLRSSQWNLERVWISWASGGPDTPQRNRNYLPDRLRTIPVESICKRWKDLQLIDDGKEVGGIWWSQDYWWDEWLWTGLFREDRRVDFGALPKTWEQHSKEGRICDLYIDRRWEDEKNPRALARKLSFWYAYIAMEWMSLLSEIRWKRQTKLRDRSWLQIILDN